MSETSLQSRILRALGSQPHIRLFRNQCGFGYVGTRVSRQDHGIMMLANARPVTFGLHPGSSDLIGWRQLVVTPDMVGRRLAVFLGVEVKTDTGRLQRHQQNWQHVVRQHGGIAIVARTDDPIQLQQLIDAELI
jgi:hypothetical protein